MADQYQTDNAVRARETEEPNRRLRQVKDFISPPSNIPFAVMEGESMEEKGAKLFPTMVEGIRRAGGTLSSGRVRKSLNWWRNG